MAFRTSQFYAPVVKTYRGVLRFRQKDIYVSCKGCTKIMEDDEKGAAELPNNA